MNLLNKSVLTAVNGAHSGTVLSDCQHLCWQTGFLLQRTKSKELVFASAVKLLSIQLLISETW